MVERKRGAAQRRVGALEGVRRAWYEWIEDDASVLPKHRSPPKSGAQFLSPSQGADHEALAAGSTGACAVHVFEIDELPTVRIRIGSPRALRGVGQFFPGRDFGRRCSIAFDALVLALQCLGEGDVGSLLRYREAVAYGRFRNREADLPSGVA